MAFTAVGIARNLHDYGHKATEYEATCKSTIDSLIQIRAQATINYKEEADLITFLEEIENGKDISTGKAALDLGNKTVKLCIGPTAGIASNIITSVVKNQSAGNDDLVGNLSQAVLNEGINQIQKEATKELCNSTTELVADYAADWFGFAAGTAALAFAPLAFGVAGLAGITACALSSTVRDTCMDYVTNTAKGAGALFSEAFQNGKTKKIIDSYKLWHHKWTKLNGKQEDLNQITADLQSLNDGQDLNKTNLKNAKKQIKTRRKERFYNRFVYWMNGKSSFAQSLTRLLTSISQGFEKEVNAQNQLIAEKRNLKISIKNQDKLIVQITKEVDQLKQKLQLKKPIVDNLEKEYSNHLE